MDENRKNDLLKFENLVRMFELKEKFLEVPEGTVCLNLGCGDDVISSTQWVNIDKYLERPGIIKGDFVSPECAPSSVHRILSSHSLEHAPIRLALKALLNWHKVLVPGGELMLLIPDLEGITYQLTHGDLSEDQLLWFRYTLFGFQANQDVPWQSRDYGVDINPGEFHTCGWTSKMITMDLVRSGFKIKELFKYNGFNTPSICVLAEVEK
jgi:hypothetical protein